MLKSASAPLRRSEWHAKKSTPPCEDPSTLLPHAASRNAPNLRLSTGMLLVRRPNLGCMRAWRMILLEAARSARVL
eukprot:5046657-Alexandrium_andersonii.AAC.1